MLAFEDLPPPHPATTIALLGLTVVLWLLLRVQILKRQWARGASDQDSLRAPLWLKRFSRWPSAYGALAVAAAAFGVLLLLGLS